MSLNQYVVLYFVVFASLGISAGVIHKKYMTQTLRKYGKKYRREIIHKSKKEQIDIYINLCKQHNISNKFAKYLLFYHKIHKSLYKNE